MSWYVISASHPSKDLFGKALLVELPESGLEQEEAFEMVKDVFSFTTMEIGEKIKSFGEKDWELDSREFDSEEEFLVAFDSIDTLTLPNRGYSLEFGEFVVNEEDR